MPAVYSRLVLGCRTSRLPVAPGLWRRRAEIRFPSCQSWGVYPRQGYSSCCFCHRTSRGPPPVPRPIPHGSLPLWPCGEFRSPVPWHRHRSCQGIPRPDLFWHALPGTDACFPWNTACDGTGDCSCRRRYDSHGGSRAGCPCVCPRSVACHGTTSASSPYHGRMSARTIRRRTVAAPVASGGPGQGSAPVRPGISWGRRGGRMPVWPLLVPG